MIMTFGEKLRKLREYKGYGLKRLGKELDIDYTYLSQIETGKRPPKRHVIDKILLFFNISDEERYELYALAEKVPTDVLEIIRKHPVESAKFLRKQFKRKG